MKDPVTCDGCGAVMERPTTVVTVANKLPLQRSLIHFCGACTQGTAPLLIDTRAQPMRESLTLAWREVTLEACGWLAGCAHEDAWSDSTDRAAPHADMRWCYSCGARQSRLPSGAWGDWLVPTLTASVVTAYRKSLPP